VTAAWPRSGIHKLPDMAGWMVPSATTPGAFWHVSWTTRATTHPPQVTVTVLASGPRNTASGGPGGASIVGRIVWTCTCPAGRERGEMVPAAPDRPDPCRHILAVARAEENDGLPPRPPGRTGDLSRFTD
jgi:hypothetical protein